MRQPITKLAAVAALAAGLALAQTPAPTQQKGLAKQGFARKAVRQRMMQALNLTDAQKQEAKTIFQQAKQNTQPIAQQLKQNRQALAAAVKANDTAQIQQLSSQQGLLRGQVLAIRSGAMAKFYSTLTPEQKAKSDQMHQRLQQRMQQRMQRHNG